MLPRHRMIAVGFSMGANVVIKYLGEVPERQKLFQGAISFCQGYDIIKWVVRVQKGQVLQQNYFFSITISASSSHLLSFLSNLHHTFFTHLQHTSFTLSSHLPDTITPATPPALQTVSHDETVESDASHVHAGDDKAPATHPQALARGPLQRREVVWRR